MLGAIAVGIGGAFGAMARYGLGHLGLKLLGTGFPYATLGVNVVGSFAMGALIAVFAHFWQPPESVKLLMVTGFLGAFTTFSAFSLDAVNLFERGETILAVGYVSGSVVFSIAGLLAGLYLVRGLAA